MWQQSKIFSSHDSSLPISHGPSAILICWFDVQETFLIIISVHKISSDKNINLLQNITFIHTILSDTYTLKVPPSIILNMVLVWILMCLKVNRIEVSECADASTDVCVFVWARACVCACVWEWECWGGGGVSVGFWCGWGNGALEAYCNSLFTHTHTHSLSFSEGWWVIFGSGFLAGIDIQCHLHPIIRRARRRDMTSDLTTNSSCQRLRLPIHLHLLL